MKSLSEHIIIRNSKLASRLFFAPINPGFTINGDINEKYCDFFLTRTGHGIGVCYLGNVSVNQEYRSNSGTAVLRKTATRAWSQLSQCISKNGSVAGIQLANPEI